MATNCLKMGEESSPKILCILNRPCEMYLCSMAQCKVTQKATSPVSVHVLWIAAVPYVRHCCAAYAFLPCFISRGIKFPYPLHYQIPTCGD